MRLPRDLARYIDIMFRPGSATRKLMELDDGFVFYYKATIVPVILFLLLSFILSGYAVGFFQLVSYAAFLWIVVPIVIIIQAAIMHFVCNFALKEFKRGYYETMAASIYAAIPIIFISWLLPISLLGPALFVISLIWSFLVLVIALSNLQRISRLNAVLAVFLTYAFEIIVATLLSMLLVLGVFGILSGLLGFAGLHV